MAVFGLIVFCSALAWGQDQKQLTASLKTGPIYPLGRWLPIQIECKNPTNRPISGAVVLPVGSSAGGYEWVLPVQVPARSRLRSEMLVKVLWQVKEGRSGQKSDPLATLFWRSGEGAELARDLIYAVSDASSGLGGTESTGLPGAIVLYVSEQPVSSEIDDPVDLTTLLTRNSSYKFTLMTSTADRLTRRTMTWDAVRVVMIDQSALEWIDPAQQQALLDHVAGGASLVVIPRDSSIQSSWIGPLLPMDLVGERESDRLESREFLPIRLTQTVRHFVGVLRPQSFAVASSQDNTFAAYRQYGLGRIVMTVFPVNALSSSNSQSFAVWSELLGISRNDFHDPQRLIESVSVNGVPDASTKGGLNDLLSRMVGAQAPSWKTAAGISLFYTGIVGVLLFLAGPLRRPAMVLGCVAGGILLATIVVGVSVIRSEDQPLMMASIRVNDLAGRSSVTRETMTFFGPAPTSGVDMKLSPESAVSPVLCTGRQPARIQMFPFEVQSIFSSTGSLASIWEVTSFKHSSSAVRCELRFGAEGTSMRLEGPPNFQLESPRLLIGASVVPLSPIRGGTDFGPIGARNVPGDYSDTAAGVIADEESRLRTEILTTVETRRDPILGLMRRSLEPRLVGFDSQPDSVPKISVPVRTTHQTLLRIPVQIRACDTGEKIRIDPAFVQIRREAAVSLPYRPDAGIWTEASQGGPWLVGLSAPPSIGLIKPDKLRLEVDLRATGYRFVIQRGQVVNGKVQDRPSGEVLMEWNNTDTRKMLQIDLRSEDIDENGWVWLRMTAAPVGESGWGALGSGPGTLPNWQMLRFDATLWGTVVSAPQPIKITWPTETSLSTETKKR